MLLLCARPFVINFSASMSPDLRELNKTEVWIGQISLWQLLTSYFISCESIKRITCCVLKDFFPSKWKRFQVLAKSSLTAFGSAMESGEIGIYFDANVTGYYWQECMKFCKSAVLAQPWILSEAALFTVICTKATHFESLKSPSSQNVFFFSFLHLKV